MEKACDALRESNVLKVRVDAGGLVSSYSEKNVFSLPLSRVDLDDNIIAGPKNHRLGNYIGGGKVTGF